MLWSKLCNGSDAAGVHAWQLANAVKDAQAVDVTISISYSLRLNLVPNAGRRHRAPVVVMHAKSGHVVQLGELCSLWDTKHHPCMHVSGKWDR